MKINVGAEIRVTEIPQWAIRELTKDNEFPNPDFHKKRAMGLWIGSTPSTIRLWKLDDRGLILPRGYLNRLYEKTESGILPTCGEISDDTVFSLVGGWKGVQGTLDSYQETAVHRMSLRRSGYLVSPTGSGKTKMGMTLLPRIGTKALWIVHTRELMRQTCMAMKEWLDEDPGKIGEGKWNIGDRVTVAMIQTLARHPEREELKQFGLVVVDECHHQPCRSWEAVLREIPARYRYGLTATPNRKDGLGFLIDSLIGPKLWTVSAGVARESGRTVKVRRVKIHTGWRWKLRKLRDWGTMLSAMILDHERNVVIVGWAKKHVEGGGSKLVILTDRVEHVTILGRMAENAGLEPVLLHGEMGKGQRESNMDLVRGGAKCTIATTSLMGEGVDVPGWDVLILATPVGWGTRKQQAIGRVARASEGKTSAVVLEMTDAIEYPEKMEAKK